MVCNKLKRLQYSKGKTQENQEAIYKMVTKSWFTVHGIKVPPVKTFQDLCLLSFPTAHSLYLTEAVIAFCLIISKS